MMTEVWTRKGNFPFLYPPEHLIHGWTSSDHTYTLTWPLKNSLFLIKCFKYLLRISYIHKYIFFTFYKANNNRKKFFIPSLHQTDNRFQQGHETLHGDTLSRSTLYMIFACDQLASFLTFSVIMGHKIIRVSNLSAAQKGIKNKTSIRKSCYSSIKYQEDYCQRNRVVCLTSGITVCRQRDRWTDRQMDPEKEKQTPISEIKSSFREWSFFPHPFSHLPQLPFLFLCVDRCTETIAKLAEDADQRFSVAYL